jgi:hypothetical protein
MMDRGRGASWLDAEFIQKVLRLSATQPIATFFGICLFFKFLTFGTFDNYYVHQPRTSDSLRSWTATYTND